MKICSKNMFSSFEIKKTNTKVFGDQSVDLPGSIVLFAIVLFFIVDTILSLYYARWRYVCSMAFYLDLLVTFTLTLEIPMVFDYVNDVPTFHELMDEDSELIQSDVESGALVIAKALRITRTLSLTRTLKLFRMIRVGKLFLTLIWSKALKRYTMRRNIRRGLSDTNILSRMKTAMFANDMADGDERLTWASQSSRNSERGSNISTTSRKSKLWKQLTGLSKTSTDRKGTKQSYEDMGLKVKNLYIDILDARLRLMLKKNLANKIFGYLARCEFWLKIRW